MSDCNNCGNNPCGGGCEPARYSCGFDIQADPFDPTTWLFDFCGELHRIKIPPLSETCTNLSTNFSTASLIYNSECGQDIIDGCSIGGLIDLDCLRDVDAPDPDSCDLFVYDPGCSECGDGCKPRPARWRNYHIPDAGDCEMEPDENGNYQVLTKDDCGCIVECNLPVVAPDASSLNFIRDSVPDDPDFPWYYGSYNDKINLHLKENAPRYFGKFDLKVTINYGVQAIRSDRMPENYHFTSRMVPVIDGDSIRMVNNASILDGYCIVAGAATSGIAIPWGTMSMRGSIVLIVPKGKEAYIYHEYRVRYNSSFPNYAPCPVNGKKVPDEEASLNSALWPASRLNALQVLVEPVSGHNDYEPVADDVRDQLDAPVDVYAALGQGA